MKVLRLRFKNIHSLKGEHALDFTIAPLVDAGLFAIIGPTGAGKSTILDVITLALFNKIPRFASKGTESISRPEIEKLGSVMTHFADDAYAEIEYGTNQGIFRSRWSISKARTGNLKDYEMQLSELVAGKSDGHIFDLKKSQVPEKNEQLLGLKYEQFIRSILLSQGDFARLLRSDDKDRAALLEDITDTGIYREIGKRTFETAKLKRQEIEALRLQLSFIKYLSDEDIDIKKAFIMEAQQSISLLDIQIAESNEKYKELSQLLMLKAKIIEIQKSLHLLQDKKSAYASKAEKLQRHQKLDLYRERFSIWQMDKKNWHQTSDEISSLQLELKKVSNSFSEVLSKMSQFTGQQVNEENFMIVMKQFEQEVNHLDAQLVFIKENGVKARLRLQQIFSKEANSTFAYIAAMKPNDGLKEVEMLLNQNKEITGDVDIENLISHRNKCNQKREQLINIQNGVSQLEKNRTENANLTLQIDKLNISILDATRLLSEHEKKITLLDQKESALNTEKEKWLQIATLDDHRAKLEDGKPCPLCGAEHHPYAHDLPVRVLDVELQIRAVKQEVISIKEEIKSMTISISKDQSTVTNYQQMILKNKEEIDILLKKHGNNVLTSKEILLEISTLETELGVINSKIEALSNIQVLEGIHQILQEIHRLLEEHASIHTKRQSLFKGQNVSNEANVIQNQFIAFKESAQRLSTTIKTKDEDASRIFLKWTEMSKELEKDLVQLGYQTIEDAIQNLLPDDTLRQYLLEKEALTNEETSLVAQSSQAEADLKLLSTIEGDHKTLEDLKIKISSLQNEKDKINNLIGGSQKELEQDAIQRNEALQLKKIIDKKEKQANPYLHLNEFIGDQTGNKYAKFAQNISLKHLIFLANQRLSRLTDRYMLKMTEIEDDFRVLDLYQAGIDRSVKTLSGGETFIVSLALALSLSDMASQNVKLESLFIDEGFGTLDQETLETAMLTLEKLQSESNRSIGIISHVDSLKERITTQIRVHKNSQGYSALEVV